jgi:hypothetical protein
MPDEDITTVYKNKNNQKDEWRCKYCTKTYLLSGGTAAPSAHLTASEPKGHGILLESPRQEKAKNQQDSIAKAMATGAEQSFKHRRLNPLVKYENAIDPGTLEVLFVQFIVACSLPFRLVECPEFRAFLYYLNTEIDNWLPLSHVHIRTWVMRQYDGHKTKLKQLIQSARSRVHISCDLWTSPNSLAILGIVGHFVSEDGQLQQCVLALKELNGEHTGEDLATVLISVIGNWGFASKIGYFMMDNASNNDTMMRSLGRGKYYTRIYTLAANIYRTPPEIQC